MLFLCCDLFKLKKNPYEGKSVYSRNLFVSSFKGLEGRGFQISKIFLIPQNERWHNELFWNLKI